MQLRFYILKKIGLLLAEIWPKTSQKADMEPNFMQFSGGGHPDHPTEL